MMTKDRDKHLENYLAGKDGLSTLYSQTPVDEPSSSVDKAILQAARAAVSKKSAGTGPFSGRWQIPAALAAVLVLAVGITLTLERQVGNEARQLERYSPMNSVPQPDAAKQKAAGKALPLKERARTGSAAADAREDESVLLRSQPAPAVESAPAAAEVFKAPQESLPGSTSPAKSTVDGVNKEQPEAAPSEPRAAERWLQSIQALVRQGKMDEARRQLKDFRRVYPEYPLPEALQKLLQ